MNARRKRTPWDRLVRAGKRGVGCRLTAEDVQRLLSDGAILKRGTMDGNCYAEGHDPSKCHDEQCD